MAWVKLDDRFHWDSTVRELSSDAYRLYIGGLCYCNWQETDGEIRKSDLAMIGPCAAAVSELETAGLWLRTPTGYTVKNYLKFQPSKAQLEAKRTKMHELGVAGGQASARNRGASTVALQPASLNPDRPAQPGPTVPTDRTVRIIGWWCEKRGWTEVPVSQRARELRLAGSLAELEIEEDDLVASLEEVWNRAERKPVTLAYFWQPMQDRAHELVKVRKPVDWIRAL